MNDTLKASGRIGAELGAAKAENDMLRGLLTQALEFTEANTCGGPDVAQLIAEMRAALSKQAEPTDTFTAVDMATAAAQGFRDGQAAVEQAPAQDEREAFIAAAKHHKVEGLGFNLEATNSGSFRDNETRMLHEGWKLARANRPAQTEQQPVAWADAQQLKALVRDYSASCAVWNSQGRSRVPLYAAPIAQTASRCQCCGYLVTDSEHRGCLRAATPSPAKRGEV